MNRNDFAQKLKRIRQRKDLNQEDLAKALNYSQQTISKWELGITSPDPEAIQKLAEIFNVKVSDLITDPILLEESGHYGAPLDLFDAFFRSKQFKDYYDLSDESIDHLSQTLYLLCESISKK